MGKRNGSVIPPSTGELHAQREHSVNEDVW